MSSENKMTYVRLGKSGLKVSKLILGCMSYGSPKHQEWILDEKTSIEHIKYAHSLGINTFDTADVYSAGESEVVLGKALKEMAVDRESVVVLTKLYNVVDKNLEGGAAANHGGLSRKYIFSAIQASLKRLQLDYVDVLQCHRFDYNTPIEETMQALHDVVQKGWVRYIGMSSCFAYQFHAMQNYAINNRLTPFISMQNFFNAAYREEEREMVPTLKLFGVGMIPWSPLCRGFLARPWDAEETVRVKTDNAYKSRGTHLPDQARKDINERVQEVADKRGVAMSQVALAWVLANDFITAPIIGSTSKDNLTQLVAALDIKLSDEEQTYLSEPYTPRAIVGHT